MNRSHRLTFVVKIFFAYREVQHECGGELTLSQSAGNLVIQSPEFPEPYPSSVDCIWFITAPRGKKVQIDFDPAAFKIKEPTNDV